MIQYNSINSFKEIHYNGHSIKSVYDYQANKVWPQETPPTPTNYKWLATYTGGTVSSAECDSTSAISFNEIAGNKLITLEIGDCVTVIGLGACENYKSLTSVTIPDSVISIGTDAFEGCSGLTSIDIPNSVTTISGNAFQYCTSLTSVTIGSSVTSIGNGAFGSCSGLTSIDIPDSVTTIGDSGFYGCTSLTSVTIPSGVTSIGHYAFRTCRSLTAITCNATTPPSLGNGALVETNNCPIYVPYQSLAAYQTAWSGYASRIQAIP